jgi:hypothetical protein
MALIFTEGFDNMGPIDAGGVALDGLHVPLGASSSGLLTLDSGDTVTDAIEGLNSLLSQFSIGCTVAGQPGAGEQLWTIPVVIAFTIAANCAGSSAVASLAATGTAIFTLGYLRAGTLTTLGTITWSAGTSGVFATTAYAAQVNDVLILTAPSVPDATLANLGIVILGTR